MAREDAHRRGAWFAAFTVATAYFIAWLLLRRGSIGPYDPVLSCGVAWSTLLVSFVTGAFCLFCVVLAWVLLEDRDTYGWSGLPWLGLGVVVFAATATAVGVASGSLDACSPPELS